MPIPLARTVTATSLLSCTTTWLAALFLHQRQGESQCSPTACAMSVILATSSMVSVMYLYFSSDSKQQAAVGKLQPRGRWADSCGCSSMAFGDNVQSEFRVFMMQRTLDSKVHMA